MTSPNLPRLAAHEPASAAIRSTARATQEPSHPPIPSAASSLSGIDSLAFRETPHAPFVPQRRSRTGKYQVDAIRTFLSDRDLAVLRSLDQHRFLTTSHIEHWHFTQHESPVAAARTTRRVLARLRDLDLITSLQRRLGGSRAGSTSYVWHLTSIGQRLLGQQARQRRIREPAIGYLQHELGIAETHVTLIEAAHAGVIDLIDVSTEPACWRAFTGPGNAAVTLKPDLFVVAAAAQHDFETVLFCEYDRATESIPTIVKKASVYEAYRATGKEQRRSGTFPRVLWIVPDAERAVRIRAALGKAARITAELHQLATPRRVLDAVVSEAGSDYV